VQARIGKSEACWALHENGKLLLFVHGFGGSATGTWRSFRELLLEDPVFSGYDMVFYGYESRRARASASAELFFDFVDRFLRTPSAFANHSLEVSRDHDFKYSEIFLGFTLAGRSGYAVYVGGRVEEQGAVASKCEDDLLCARDCWCSR
jgi:hypothetical protein